MSKKFRLWLIAAVITTALSGLVYLSTQQVLRLGANDPQIQTAEDTAAELTSGQKPETVVPTTKVDIEKSLAPFVIILDKDGKVLASSAVLNGQTPAIPTGVLSYVTSHGEDRLTWQPQTRVRAATVITKFSGSESGFVLVGRSLTEVEKRENLLLAQVSGAWVLTLLVLALVILLYPITKEKAAK